MTADYCDIQAAIAAGNFTLAQDIYATGKNSFSGLARRTFYRFATFAPAAGVVEPLHDALAMGRNATWLDTMIKDAMARRRGALALGLVQVAALKYFLHEVDEGFTKVSIYLNDTVNNAVLIDDLTGAPHNVDEAFALWAGGSPRACATLSGWAARLGADLDTTFANRSYVNSAMTLALNELLANSRTGSREPYNVTRFLVQRHLTVLGLQGVMHSAYLAQAAAACKRPTAQIDDAKAAVAVHWTYLRPLLAARRAPAADIKKIEDAVFAASPSSQTVLTAVR
ncbi:hypothetical protein PLESTB_001165500 [Pleodorina starrii]|uniref:Uncharacterized protein n=1 Tax=Pleodorina starrii TaxID=330485 RepID=A0A9W6F591_9CHLO|nr:hypothetical protein PLESTB_001165500 [Pleodorina starrii]